MVVRRAGSPASLRRASVAATPAAGASPSTTPRSPSCLAQGDGHPGPRVRADRRPPRSRDGGAARQRAPLSRPPRRRRPPVRARPRPRRPARRGRIETWRCPTTATASSAATSGCGAARATRPRAGHCRSERTERTPSTIPRRQHGRRESVLYRRPSTPGRTDGESAPGRTGRTSCSGWGRAERRRGAARLGESLTQARTKTGCRARRRGARRRRWPCRAAPANRLSLQRMPPAPPPGQAAWSRARAAPGVASGTWPRCGGCEVWVSLGCPCGGRGRRRTPPGLPQRQPATSTMPITSPRGGGEVRISTLTPKPPDRSAGDAARPGLRSRVDCRSVIPDRAAAIQFVTPRGDRARVGLLAGQVRCVWIGTGYWISVSTPPPRCACEHPARCQDRDSDIQSASSCGGTVRVPPLAAAATTAAVRRYTGPEGPRRAVHSGSRASRGGGWQPDLVSRSSPTLVW